jgi:hypothetical protein
VEKYQRRTTAGYKVALGVEYAPEKLFHHILQLRRCKNQILSHLNHIQVAKRRGDVDAQDATERYLQNMLTFEMVMAAVNTVEVTL